MIQTFFVVAIGIGFIFIYYFFLQKPMSQQEKVIEAFEHFIGVDTLYQTFDGELFVELPDAQVYAASLLSQAIINIPRPLTVPDEVMQNAGKWVFLPNGSTSVLQKNLVVNGFGELGGLVNFSKFQRYVLDDTNGTVNPNNIGEQCYLVDSKAAVNTDDFFAIDPSKMYLVDLLATTEGVGVCEFEIGLQFYDQDFALIDRSYIDFQNSNVTLVAPLVAGDTFVSVNSIPSFVSGAGSGGLRNLAFLKHTFKNGRVSVSYGKNRIDDAYPQSNYLDTSGGQKKILLNVPYTGVTVPTGTRVVNPTTVETYKLKMDESVLTHSTTRETTRFRRAFGGDANAFVGGNNVNISRFARYAKLYVKQVSVQYFKLILSDISVNIAEVGSDITVRTMQNFSFMPLYDASLLPNGFRYYLNETMYESLDGSWVEFPYSQLSVGPPPPPEPPV